MATTFEEYCEERWEMPRQHACRLVSAAAFAEKVVCRQLATPSRQSQIRPLLERLQRDDDRIAVWRDVERAGIAASPIPAVIRASVAFDQHLHRPSLGLEAAVGWVRRMCETRPSDAVTHFKRRSSLPSDRECLSKPQEKVATAFWRYGLPGKAATISAPWSALRRL
jgi:hypothetical protein